MTPARAWRRLLVCVIGLALADLAVVPLLRRAEAARYESDRQMRFENSDLFMLGPLTDYLLEHPKGDRPRAAFFGNSIVWGYGLNADQAMPSVFQRLRPDTRVLNFAVNGFETGNAYLISKALLDAVDTFYVFPIGTHANAMLPQLIPVAQDDLARFGLRPPSTAERLMRRCTAWWKLPRYSYRLQAAWFGTSTRQYVYLRKGEIARRMLRGHVPLKRHVSPEDPVEPASPALPKEEATWSAPLAPRVTEADAERVRAMQPLLWEYAELLASHRKRGVLIEVGPHMRLTDEERGVFNARFAPFVTIAKLTVPESWCYDGTHFTAEGAAGVAAALAKRAGPAGK